jgi:hypothetical protein
MTPQMTNDLRTVLNWFEEEPELWYVVNSVSLSFEFIHSSAKYIGLS